MRVAVAASLFIFAALSSSALHAGEPQGQAALPPGMGLKKMVTLTSDRNSDVFYLHLMMKQTAPTGMFVEPDSRNQPDPDSSPKGTPFYLADIEKPEGVALFETQGRKVLIMQGQLNRTSFEGRFKLKYLADGLGMTYESCDFLLRNTNGEFWAQNAYNGQKITDVVIETSFFGVVTLKGICPQ